MVADVNVAALLDELVVMVGGDRRPAALDLANRLAEGRLRVAVVGEAKRGKSTLVNALLGASLLPVGVAPVTALATSVRYGSPPRVVAEHLDGTVTEHPLSALWDLVTEVGNPDNRRALAEVVVYADVALLRGGVELIDTPGVGSVYVQATANARAAHDQLDAAIFVLTVDPPLSASERDLLRDIANRAVALFIVLNKVDRLDPAERDEALRFVSNVLTETLGQPSVTIYPTSATSALPATDGALAGLDSDLAEYLQSRRDPDLIRAVAAHAERLARASLDEALLTRRAADLAASDARGQVDAFRACLESVEEHRRDAVDIVRSAISRAVADLSDSALWEGPGISAEVHAALEETLERLSGSPAQVEDEARAVAGELAARLVGCWCDDRREAVDKRLGELASRLTRSLNRDLDAVRGAASELLGLPLSLPAPECSSLPRPFVDSTYRPDIGYTTDLAASLRRRLPGRVGQNAVRRALVNEVDEIVSRQVGRARSAFHEILTATGSELARAIDRRYGEATGGLATALSQAETLATASVDESNARYRDLAAEADALGHLLMALHELTVAGTPEPLGHG